MTHTSIWLTKVVQLSTSSNDIWICNAVLEDRHAKQNNNNFEKSNMVAITVSHCTSLVF